MKHQSVEWLEDMLAYCTNLLSQIGDYGTCELKDDEEGFVDYPATTGPADDPDRYDLRKLLSEIRKKYPEF